MSWSLSSQMVTNAPLIRWQYSPVLLMVTLPLSPITAFNYVYVPTCQVRGNRWNASHIVPIPDQDISDYQMTPLSLVFEMWLKSTAYIITTQEVIRALVKKIWATLDWDSPPNPPTTSWSDDGGTLFSEMWLVKAQGMCRHNDDELIMTKGRQWYPHHHHHHHPYHDFHHHHHFVWQKSTVVTSR